jgi:hypothetical protein
MALDAVVGIRLFGKLKLTKCARAERRAGHFYVRAEKRLFFSLLFTRQQASHCRRVGSVQSCKRLTRYAQPLRQLHGSGAVREPVYCFRIVFSIRQRSGAMHSRKSFALSGGNCPEQGRINEA